MSHPAESGHSPSLAMEAASREWTASFAKGIEDADRRRAELGIPDDAGISDPRVRALALESLSPESRASLERTVRRNWWTLYEDDDDEAAAT